MTPDQQEAALSGDEEVDEETLYFSSEEEYLTWKRDHGSR